MWLSVIREQRPYMCTMTSTQIIIFFTGPPRQSISAYFVSTSPVWYTLYMFRYKARLQCGKLIFSFVVVVVVVVVVVAGC